MNKIRLLLADDHADVLTYLASRLRSEADIEIIGEATNSAQAIALALTEKPNAILIDPMMRDGLGLNALRQISARCPESHLVVLTAVVDTAQSIEYRKIGIRKVLIKGIESTKLVQELHKLVESKGAVEERRD
jgi:NarL family two-component system response regulator LiaR